MVTALPVEVAVEAMVAVVVVGGWVGWVGAALGESTGALGDKAPSFAAEAVAVAVVVVVE